MNDEQTDEQPDVTSEEDGSDPDEASHHRWLRRFWTEVSEESVLFISVVKWFLLASAVGALVGASTAFFLDVLAWGERLMAGVPNAFLFLPLGIAASALLIKYLAPEAEGHGTEKVIETVHKRAGKTDVKVIPVKLLATVITLATGGSAGKEGPAAQIGAGVCSLAADALKLDDADRRKLVICGISGGFASVFGTPIAGAVFGIEVLFCGRMLYDVLLPAFVSGMTAYHVGVILGVEYPHQPSAFLPDLSEAFFVKVGLSGIFFGICALLLIEALTIGERTSKHLRIGTLPKALLGGGALVGLAYLISTEYLGLGLNTIDTALQGGYVPGYAFLAKILFTAITLSFGGSGGIVTPMFFIGAVAGNFFGRALGLDPATFAAIGMVAVVAGGANTPIAASIMAVELFGTELGTYAAGACVVAFLMTGHRSVYPSQVLAIRKSSSLHVPIGRELDEVPVGIRPREHTVIGMFVKVGQSVNRTLDRRRRIRAIEAKRGRKLKRRRSQPTAAGSWRNRFFFF